MSLNVQAQSTSSFASFADMYIHNGGNFSVFSGYVFSQPSTSVQGMIYAQRSHPAAQIYFAAGSSWTGAKGNSCVDGYVLKTGSSAFTYPVGDNGNYRPIALSNPSGAMVAYYNADPNTAVTSNAFGGTYTALPAGAPFSTSSFASNLKTISPDEYWHLDGSSTTNVTLTWDANSDIATLAENDLENLTIVGWNGSSWELIESTVDVSSLDNSASSPAYSTSSSTLSTGSITTNTGVNLNNYNIVTFGCVSIYRLNAKVFLQGCYDASTGLMYDSLRSKGYIPTSEPYSAFANFTHVGDGGGETIPSASASSILGVTGSNAIVDWVFVELRSSSDSSVVVETRSALLQRDGDIVKHTNGTGKLKFTGLSSGSYYIAVRHRNHLGVMSADPETLSYYGTTVDFTDGNTAKSGEFDYASNHPTAGTSYNFSGLAQKTIGSSTRVMWAGDGNQDGKLKYTAPSDDVGTVLFDVLLYSGNTSFAYNYNNAFGYLNGDYDMNGKAKYTAPGDDVNTLLFNVLLYPNNTGYAYNYNLFLEQLP